jgi:hypothetical protein
MKLHSFVLGGVLCLVALASGQTGQSQPSSQNSKSTQSADRLKQPAAATGQSVTGCVDEQGGHYVLRDTQSGQLIQLQTGDNTADEQFARFVGHQAQASGTLASGKLTVAHIAQVADMCPVGQ